MTFNGDVAAYIERLPVGVYRSTRDGRLLMANPAFAAMFGFGSIDPYFRADSSDAPPGSIGLGLSVSRDLARLMGGDLRHQVTDGTSGFALTLPLSATEHRAASTQASVG